MSASSSTPPAQAMAIPFWQRLPEIATYPLRGAALASLTALTLVSLLGLIPLVGWLVSILVLLAMYRYAFEVLRATADGRMQAPEVVLDVDDGLVIRLIAMHLVFIAVMVLVVWLVGPFAGLATLGLIAFLQPAAVMTLAMDGSLLHALNPVTAATIVQRVGWPYLAMVGLLFLIQASMVAASIWLDALLPWGLSDLAGTAVGCWGLFAAFHLLGYVVYQYQEVLGHDLDDKDTIPDRTRPGADGDLHAEVQGYVDDGQPAAALQLLREETRSRAVSMETHELHYRLLREHGEAAALAQHSADYINLLLLDQHDRRALAVLREALQADPDFLPLEVEQAERLHEYARQSDQTQVALDCLQALLRGHPRHPHAPRWGLDAALLMAERMGRDDDARALLARAREQCDDAELLQRIDAAATALQPLANT